MQLCDRDAGGALVWPITTDLCVAKRTALFDGDVRVTVRTSAASTWNFGVAQPADPVPAEPVPHEPPPGEVVA